jgi:hypothetical protein
MVCRSVFHVLLTVADLLFRYHIGSLRGLEIATINHSRFRNFSAVLCCFSDDECRKEEEEFMYMKLCWLWLLLHLGSCASNTIICHQLVDGCGLLATKPQNDLSILGASSNYCSTCLGFVFAFHPKMRPQIEFAIESRTIELGFCSGAASKRHRRNKFPNRLIRKSF